MRVEPEQVLKEDRVAAELRVEDADARQTLHGHQHESDGNYRRGKEDDDAGGVHRPNEERQAEPGQARRAHAMDGDDEVEPGQDCREAEDEHADRRGHDESMRAGAVGSVEGIDQKVNRAPMT